MTPEQLAAAIAESKRRHPSQLTSAATTADDNKSDKEGSTA